MLAVLRKVLHAGSVSFLLEHRRCVKDAHVPKAAEKEGGSTLLSLPSGPHRFLIQHPGRRMVYSLFKAAIVLGLGLVNLLWFKTVEPAVCNLM